MSGRNGLLRDGSFSSEVVEQTAFMSTTSAHPRVDLDRGRRRVVTLMLSESRRVASSAFIPVLLG